VSSDRLGRGALVASLMLGLRKVSAQSLLFRQAVAERLGMHPTDLVCMDILYRTGAVTAGRLAELTDLTTGAITGTIDRLEKAGYVRREPNPNDRRSVIVRPLPDREHEVAVLYDSMADAMTELCAAYSDQELTLIIDFYNRTLPVVQGETAKMRIATVAQRRGEQ
jgi:DNA-binding MarR family transcriptional regulator